MDYAGRTMYDASAIRQTAVLYFRFMNRLSSMLYSDVLTNADDALVGSEDDFARYVLAREALEAGEMRRVQVYLQGDEGRCPWCRHLAAHARMLRGEYAQAQALLVQLLHDESARSEVLVYCLFCDLEICCREQSDFRGAYEYSQNKVALLEKMLR